ncbi:hypothetical protein [Amycolatopsis sp. H20-H5]|uniref:hypothetical protein n=1 Tax=Amycolatopsis sp. H20-H5 TaxID=3046309 RepID=UPI002DBE9EF8|nr:hypothetical protein [Amycolatopsis sp. H20-H5]MEC3976394.1 hypothetical protein [Amycolatopsis sp. H20-H5]
MSGYPWHSPYVGFTQAQLDAAAHAVRDLSGMDELVLVGGDRAAGLGLVNETIDLYVVGDSLPVADVVYEVDGMPLRFTALSESRVSELVSLTAGYHATTTSSPQLAVDGDRVRELIQLVTGHRLVVSSRWQAELDAIDHDTVRQMLITRRALAFAACAADAFRSMLSGDLFTAWTMSTAGLLCGCEAALAATGDFVTDGNFLFRMLARSRVTVPWFPYLWRLVNWSFPVDQPPPPARVRAIIEERLMVANLLISWCSIEGWEQKPSTLPAPPATTGVLPEGAPRRSPYFTAVRFSDAWTLLGPGQGYQTTEEVVRLWRSLDGGRQVDDCVTALAESEPGPGMTPARAESVVATLHELGAVEMLTAGHRPSPGDVPIVRTARFNLAARCSWDLRLNR